MDGYPNKTIGYLNVFRSLQLTTNMTSIVFTYITIIPGVYDINVSAVNILGENLQRYAESIFHQ